MFTKVALTDEKRQILSWVRDQKPTLFLFATENEKFIAEYYSLDGFILGVRLLEPNRLSRSKVTVNFSIEGFQYFIKTTLREGPADRICFLDFNADLYKLQRRKNFRIKVPEGDRIRFEILRVASHSIQQSFDVDNISVGGLALAVEEERVLQVQSGQSFSGRLILSDDSTLEVDACLRFQRPSKSPGIQYLAGVEFTGLSAEDEQFLFSFVMELHRRQFAAH